MLLDAQKNGYAVGAFNVENMEMVMAVMEAAEELSYKHPRAHETNGEIGCPLLLENKYRTPSRAQETRSVRRNSAITRDGQGATEPG